MEIKDLKRKDYNKAIRWAIKGMHFDWYLDSPLMQNLYGRYFWYLEMNRATQIIAAYVGDEIAGVLLADMKDEKKQHHSILECIYVTIVEFVQKKFFKDSVGVYDEVNHKMLDCYLKTANPDGEIVFLAANPDMKIKGIGTMMLNELERREKSKTIYLYTDDACSYQFYEHRGFTRVGETDIVLQLDKKEVPLKCLLYSKKLL